MWKVFSTYFPHSCELGHNCYCFCIVHQILLKQMTKGAVLSEIAKNELRVGLGMESVSLELATI